MSTIPLTPAPRMLLFPQVGRPPGEDGRPAVRRYTLTLLPGARRQVRGAPRSAAATLPRA